MEEWVVIFVVSQSKQFLHFAVSGRSPVQKPYFFFFLFLIWSNHESSFLPPGLTSALAWVYFEEVVYSLLHDSWVGLELLPLCPYPWPLSYTFGSQRYISGHLSKPVSSCGHCNLYNYRANTSRVWATYTSMSGSDNKLICMQITVARKLQLLKENHYLHYLKVSIYIVEVILKRSSVF